MKSRVKEKNKMISRGMKVQVKAASATESYMVGTAILPYDRAERHPGHRISTAVTV